MGHLLRGLAISAALSIQLSATGIGLGSHGADNYAADIRNNIAWGSFPVRVYFERNRDFSAARQNRARAGFQRWVSATGGYVRYDVTPSREGADIIVRFDPTTNDGYTTTNFTNGQITLADVKVGVKRGSGPDMEAIAAHEFGHALGIDGHSSDKADLMYPVHRMGTGYRITPRDLNTLMTVYPSIANRVADASTR